MVVLREYDVYNRPGWRTGRRPTRSGAGFGIGHGRSARKTSGTLVLRCFLTADPAVNFRYAAP